MQTVAQGLPAHKCYSQQRTARDVYYLPHKSSTKQFQSDTLVQSCSRGDGPTTVNPPTLTVCCTAAPHASPPVAFSGAPTCVHTPCVTSHHFKRRMPVIWKVILALTGPAIVLIRTGRCAQARTGWPMMGAVATIVWLRRGIRGDAGVDGKAVVTEPTGV